MASSAFGAPIPLSEIESVLAWVDSFKLSRPTKKINRDFSDAVLLAEILAVHYPKLVEMHNYPPRNSHALKLNNWMTLNRKVLKKLKLNLCCATMEQLANSSAGIIERVLVMVRDKIKRDEELERSMKETEANMSSGGSYYEACGDEEHVLVVPVKTRVNGVLETMQQKVVNLEAYKTLKQELKDAKDTADLLKQKVEHLDSLIKLKDERIAELQKQLDRKQSRRKEVENLQSSIPVPFEEIPSPTPPEIQLPIVLAKKSSEPIKISSKTIIHDTKIPEKVSAPKIDATEVKTVLGPQNTEFKPSFGDLANPNAAELNSNKSSSIELKSSQPSTDIKRQSVIIDGNFKHLSEIKDIPNNTEVKDDKVVKADTDISKEGVEDANEVDRIKSDVFKEASCTENKYDEEEFKDSEAGFIITIGRTINQEARQISSTELQKEGFNGIS